MGASGSCDLSSAWPLQGQDLASGNLTAPSIFALACEGGESQHLRELIESEFLEDQDLTEAMRIIKEGDGLAAARRLARQESDLVGLPQESMPCEGLSR